MGDRLLSHSNQNRSPLANALLVLLLIMIVHGAGRVAAVCHPYKIDSFTYSVAAYKLWHTGATAADLVADKPPGQAILTGWCYRVFPGEPTRLTLVPIESLFLLGAYAVFFLIARRLYGSCNAGVLTLFFALAHNIYNALDFTTDGFDLNENYLALPMLGAVLAHLTIRSPIWRGLVVGVAIGVALVIKQSAAGLLAAFIVSELLATLSRRRIGSGLVFCGMIVIGIVASIVPVALFLWSRGWLGAQFDTLFNQTASHAMIPPWTLPRWYNILPLMPAVWLVALGVVLSKRSRGDSFQSKITMPVEDDGSRRRAFIFLSFWLVTELSILAAMRKPATHYYQQIVAPVVLLSGFGLASFQYRVTQLDRATGAAVGRWACATTIALLVIAAMPLLSAAKSRIGTMDYNVEVREFADRIAAPTPQICLERQGGEL